MKIILDITTRFLVIGCWYSPPPQLQFGLRIAVAGLQFAPGPFKLKPGSGGAAAVRTMWSRTPRKRVGLTLEASFC